MKKRIIFLNKTGNASLNNDISRNKKEKAIQTIFIIKTNFDHFYANCIITVQFVLKVVVLKVKIREENKAKIEMKKSNVKSRIRKDDLNPIFHFKDKEEDDKVLTKGIIKQALKTGKLELSSKNLKFGRWKSQEIRT